MTRRRTAAAAWVAIVLSWADASLHPRAPLTTLRQDRVRRRHGVTMHPHPWNALTVRGGENGDDNDKPVQETVNDEDYVEFTMNSDGRANMSVQSPSLQKELNATLNQLNEFQNQISKDGTTGVAKGGAASTSSTAEGGILSSKFPIRRDEVSHFSCMSILMFLFIYVFTTGEFSILSG